jgi:hypothetical protein
MVNNLGKVSIPNDRNGHSANYTSVDWQSIRANEVRLYISTPNPILKEKENRNYSYDTKMAEKVLPCATH